MIYKLELSSNIAFKVFFKLLHNYIFGCFNVDILTQFAWYRSHSFVGDTTWYNVIKPLEVDIAYNLMRNEVMLKYMQPIFSNLILQW